MGLQAAGPKMNGLELSSGFSEVICRRAPVAWAPDGSAVLYSRPELVAAAGPPRFQAELFRLRLPGGARERLTFTTTLNPASQPVEESGAGLVGTDTVLFRANLGAPTTSSLFRATVERAPLYGPGDQIGTDLARLLEAAPANLFFTKDPNAWQPLP